VQPLQAKRYYFTANGAAPSCAYRVMLAYSDKEGAPNVSPSLVNDLDLTLIDPNGTVYLPLTLDPVNPTALATPLANHRDNVEQVVITNPIPGTWVARVDGAIMPAGAQDVAVTWEPIASGGVCTFDRACPDVNDPCVSYVSQNPATCQVLAFTCPPLATHFTGSPCGCGCIATCP
jgi:hypothetical protein